MAALLAAMLLGGVSVALLTRMPSGHLLQVAERLPRSRFWFGIAELAFYFFCLAGYLKLARSSPELRTSRRRWAMTALAWLAGTDVAYHFPPLFSILGAYSTRVDLEHTPLRFLTALVDPEVLALTMHFLLASVSVAGLTLAWLAAHSDHAVRAERYVTVGGRIALVATLAQLPSGIWLLAQVDDRMRDPLLGQDWLATTLFGLGLAGSVALLYRLAAIALGELGRREVRLAACWLIAVVVCMAGAQQIVRQAIYRDMAGEREAQTSGSPVRR